jgi:hypothetical protein
LKASRPLVKNKTAGRRVPAVSPLLKKGILWAVNNNLPNKSNNSQIAIVDWMIFMGMQDYFSIFLGHTATLG